MPTYIYETMPNTDAEVGEYFEISQPKNDEPLAHHPETGKPIRRVIVAGNILSKPDDSDSGDCCCGPAGCCR